MSKFYELSALDQKDQPFSFEQLKGKVVLIVNVASKCGFTPQYKELEQLYGKYKDQGFIILGFPTSEFANQEFENQEEIQNFCQLNYGVTFPIMKKTKVNGAEANSVYQYLKSQKAGILGFRGIKWNFEKFLIDKEGNVVQRYSSITTPLSFESTIKELLAK
ncbi:hypothetical protein PACTADRAFT_48801 [Pachysolen tannophilus NRRL Y-2460]|uniref:Glutathione peroxidase n=1 Tax=Pachysolen tannophilus NRRL Y-2460 TaxID=669874 RepID=A0A1E4TZ57_PACTA|nr:hypothetical protein PACTADRAFT_48801 [Pachysolen tannophilus NRRL Y-2460]